MFNRFNYDECLWKRLDELMAKIIHMMIRVLDEQRSVNFYKSALNLEIAKRLEFDDFILLYLRNEETDFEVELTINKGHDGPYDLGNGYGHLAVAVDDLENQHKRLKSLSLDPTDIKEFFREEELLAKFFFLSDPDGYKIEILQRHGRYQ